MEKKKFHLLCWILSRCSFHWVWVRSLAGAEKQKLTWNFPPVGRAWRGQSCLSRSSNYNSEQIYSMLKVFGDTHVCPLTFPRGGCSSLKMVTCSKRSSVKSSFRCLRLTSVFFTQTPILIRISQTFDGTMNSVTVGCNYRKATPPSTPYMNMQVRLKYSMYYYKKWGLWLCSSK